MKRPRKSYRVTPQGDQEIKPYDKKLHHILDVDLETFALLLENQITNKDKRYTEFKGYMYMTMSEGFLYFACKGNIMTAYYLEELYKDIVANPEKYPGTKD